MSQRPKTGQYFAGLRRSRENRGFRDVQASDISGPDGRHILRNS
jgi:hypothetical protein